MENSIAVSISQFIGEIKFDSECFNCCSIRIFFEGKSQQEVASLWLNCFKRAALLEIKWHHKYYIIRSWHATHFSDFNLSFSSSQQTAAHVKTLINGWFVFLVFFWKLIIKIYSRLMTVLNKRKSKNKTVSARTKVNNHKDRVRKQRRKIIIESRTYGNFFWIV